MIPIRQDQAGGDRARRRTTFCNRPTGPANPWFVCDGRVDGRRGRIDHPVGRARGQRRHWRPAGLVRPPLLARKLVGQTTDWFDRRLNRTHRSDRSRVIRGALVVFVIAGLAGLAGWAADRLGGSFAYGSLVEVLCLLILIRQRRAFDSVRSVAHALRQEGLDSARRRIAQRTDRDTETLDAGGVARAAIEASAPSFIWRLITDSSPLSVMITKITAESCAPICTPKLAPPSV